MRSWLAAVAILSMSPSARAKGEGGGGDVPCESPLTPRPYAVRFPAAPGAPMMIASNFGILLSHDDGATFSLICPEAYEQFTAENGLQPLYSTPTLMGLADGTILATRWPLGLLRADADGCGWAIVDDDVLRTRAVSSMTMTPSGTLFVSFAAGTDPLGIATSLDGAAFTLTSAQSDTLLYDGVLAADDNVLYAITTELGMPNTVSLLASSDGGMTFDPVHAVADVLLSLGAADPANPTTLLMRRRTTAICSVNDTLVLDQAGGTAPQDRATFAGDPVTGAVFRPSGEIWVATLLGGVIRSSDGGQNFSPAGGPARARCLVGRPGEVLACLSSPDPVLGLVARTLDEGAFWTPLVTWQNVTGPPPCLADMCASHWQKMQATWIDPAMVPDGSADGLRFDLGSVGDDPEESSGGCTCAIGARADGVEWVLVGLLTLFVRRRSRRFPT